MSQIVLNRAVPYVLGSKVNMDEPCSNYVSFLFDVVYTVKNGLSRLLLIYSLAPVFEFELN